MIDHREGPGLRDPAELRLDRAEVEKIGGTPHPADPESRRFPVMWAHLVPVLEDRVLEALHAREARRVELVESLVGHGDLVRETHGADDQLRIADVVRTVAAVDDEVRHHPPDTSLEGRRPHRVMRQEPPVDPDHVVAGEREQLPPAPPQDLRVEPVPPRPRSRLVLAGELGHGSHVEVVVADPVALEQLPPGAEPRTCWRMGNPAASTRPPRSSARARRGNSAGASGCNSARSGSQPQGIPRGPRTRPFA